MTKKLFAPAMTKFFIGVSAGLSFRFGWLRFPRWVSILGAVLFLLDYVLYAFVLKENAYLARTVKVLLRELPGYAAYRQKVRWRMVPWIW